MRLVKIHDHYINPEMVVDVHYDAKYSVTVVRTLEDDGNCVLTSEKTEDVVAKLTEESRHD